jgi:hypothetical protein
VNGRVATARTGNCDLPRISTRLYDYEPKAGLLNRGFTDVFAPRLPAGTGACPPCCCCFRGWPTWAACNGNPAAKFDPTNGQTVPERSGGNPTTVTLDGSKSTPGNNDLVFQWTYTGSTPSGCR